MEREDISALNAVSNGIVSSYFKLAIAVVIGAALGLGVYFLALSNSTANTNSLGGLSTPTALCVCPQCGMTIQKPAALDCEEINCPNCGQHMSAGATLAAGGTVTPPLTQNRRETLAEQGIATPGPMTQNQRETLAEQNITVPRSVPHAEQNITVPRSVPLNPAPTAPPKLAAVDPPQARDRNCVCPNCGKTLEVMQGFSCSHVRCPLCGSTMTNAIMVGPRHEPAADLALVAMGGGPNCPMIGGTQPGQNHLHLHGGGQTAPATTNPTPPCPIHNGAAAPSQPVGVGSVAAGANTQQLTYTNTVSGIISKNCLKCHGGPIRNLTTYNNVKAYADNGLLEMMVQPGGPMSRFLTAHESNEITKWISAGAPQ